MNGLHFATPVPWWLIVALAAAIGLIAYVSYRRPLMPLSRAQRGVLTTLRALSLGLIVFFICRPVALLPPTGARDIVLPVLVDVSRSMRVADADGQTRIAR